MRQILSWQWGGLACAAAVLLLTAGCGGGAEPAERTADEGRAEALAATPIRYALRPEPTTRKALVEQLDQLGAKGYGYVGWEVFHLDDNQHRVPIYARVDAKRRYRHQVLELPSRETRLEDQLNAQGARGYSLLRFAPQGVTYRRTVGSDAKYRYRILAGPDPFASGERSFIESVESQGRKGRLYIQAWKAASGWVHLYGEIDGADALYRYEALRSPGTATQARAQLKRQGARGYRWIGVKYFDEEGYFQWLYVRNTAQSARFRYAADASEYDQAGFLAQARVRGANGMQLAGTALTQTGVALNIYFASSRCKGVLCDAYPPFGP